MSSRENGGSRSTLCDGEQDAVAHRLADAVAVVVLGEVRRRRVGAMSVTIEAG
jgi:hypothetical protein